VGVWSWVPQGLPLPFTKYNDAGNPYHQNEFGQWVPHIGFSQVCQTLVSSGYVLYSELYLS